MSEDPVKEFLIESYENLDMLDRNLVDLEQDPRNESTLANIFRTIHTIKGTCGFLAFHKLEAISHTGENHYKLHRGFRIQDGWVVDNKCDSTIRVSEVNGGGGGCRPAPLVHQVVGTTLVLREQDILGGWRFFN